MIFLLLVVAAIAAMFVMEKNGEYSYSGELQLATEYPPPHEKEATDGIVRSLKTILDKDYPPPKRMMRDAHPKQHALVKAEFKVREDIPNELKVGVFARPATYKSWIRFSNLSAGVPDIAKDSRGMAIKLMGVEGPKLLPEQRYEQTQDFVFMSTNIFVTKDAKGFADLLTSINKGKAAAAIHMLTHPRLLMLFMKVRIKIASLLDVTWGSTTPYLLGNQAVKYAVMPQKSTGQKIPSGEVAENFLRDRMTQTLGKDAFMLDFYVQVQKDPDKMPIEDPRVPWSESLSPFVKVATIKVLQQNFDKPAQNMYGDQLSFTPWHSLPEHRPLGGINRARKVIYDTMSKYRHSRNDEISSEPSEGPPFVI